MRRSNWPALLATFVEEKRDVAFSFERNNCAFFACDWLAMATGVDPAADYRERVNSPLSAARVLASEGGIERIIEVACARWNWPEISTLVAQRGDILTADGEGGPAIGVCLGARVVFAAPCGVDFRFVQQCQRAWRIK